MNAAISIMPFWFKAKIMLMIVQCQAESVLFVEITECINQLMLQA